MRSLSAFFLLAGVAAASNTGLREVDKCTAILVGAKASTTGAPMTTHSNDCSSCDFRITKIPAQSHVPGSLRNVYEFSLSYPRYVGKARGAPGYFEETLDRGLFNWTATASIGQIPQVASTYGYIEGVYPIMNDRQVAIGESTCGANLWAKPVSHGGKALFDITELARVALERSTTARDAVQLMGHVAEQYGYYSGSDWDGEPELADAGETLTVTDTKEGWVFHILPDDTGASAVWVAQRIPDTHITAIGNQFIIHTVNLTDSANFLGSSNMYDVAKRNNFWDGKSQFDFTVAYAYKQATPLYSTRRQWRVFTLANPSLTLSPYTDPFGTDYPFSVEVAQPLQTTDLIQYQRDHYEGTPFDLTQGHAAGPYGTPNRYSVGHQATTGFFERAISMYRSTYSFVTAAHPTNANLGLVWFGPYAPHATSYMPIFAKVSAVPTVASHGSVRRFDFNTSFWINALIGNYADHYYKHAMPAVLAVQLAVEQNAADAQVDIQAKAVSILASQGEAAMIAHLTAASDALASYAHDAFYALFQDLVTRFHDGSIFGNFTNDEMSVQAMGYPKWWLEQVGYFGSSSVNVGGFASTEAIIVGAVTAVALSIALGYFLGQRSAKNKGYVYVRHSVSSRMQSFLCASVTLFALAAADAKPSEPDRCTAILVGAKASTSGAPMTTHTNDCTICDFRIAKVPEKHHAPGSMRDVFLPSGMYPRYVGKDRGAPEYFEENLEKGFYNWTNTQPIGQIPQVDTTYGYIDGVYPIMNEHQLAVGESTCGANLVAKPATQGGKAFFDVRELARVAFERTTTARDAINLMGRLAEQYGYYGSEWEGDDAFGEAGETLTVTDTKEGWVFHILPDDTGASAVWVAQRIPDTHITAIGNQFIIHTVNLTDSANFLGSSNMYDVAKRNNFWDGKSQFDFTVAFAQRRQGDSYYYSTRRQWRVFTLANPSLTLSPYTDPFGTDYPFSVEVARPLSAHDLMRFQRDHYEGTPFDLTQGPEAGPYGNPDRYAVGENAFAPGTKGHGKPFERAISLYRTTYSFVTMPNASNPNLGFLWFGPYAPHATSYMPIFARVSAVPEVTNHGSLNRFDFNVSFWINALIGNYAGHYYKHAMPAVSTVQLDVERNAADALVDIQTKAVAILASQGEAAFVTYLTTSSNSLATSAHSAFYALFLDVVTRFHDGSIFGNFTNQEMSVQAMGYPNWWLEQVGYFGSSTINVGGFTSTGAIIVGAVTAVVLSIALGYFLGQRSVKAKGYAFIK
ncbi:Aste57867_3030 [Aphanomyces stellatus]|uniref:Aste57867_3030 protein n=1 Tax=Aphanomyces stellatus TaxID=120398 RepID=A0A485K9W2_9STRA|nr:hypothetical protein As57867_003021 [Aphanomyces stellatus]VFT80210.1 Aste57867_3030 [Aphanomyces stellatus]